MISLMAQAKHEARRQGLAARRALSEDDRALKSARIFDAMLHMDVYRNARRLMTFVSLPDEVQTFDLLPRILAEGGREVFVPKIIAPHHIEAVPLHHMGELARGVFDVLTVESATDADYVDPATLDLILVPGSAFDTKGGRVGMGSGYYDEFLSRATKAFRLALAYQCQVFGSVPTEAHDVPVDAILTETGLIDIKEAAQI